MQSVINFFLCSCDKRWMWHYNATMSSEMKNRFDLVTARMQNATKQGHPPLLLAVSKKHSADAVRAAFALGQRAFGESYAQEGVVKMAALSDLSIEWHFIGPIQSNKTKLIAEHFDWVQSVDRMKVLRRLAEQRPIHLPPLNILLQLKVGDEASKSGTSVDDLILMYQTAQSMPSIRVRGLMCIPPPSQSFDEQCQYFRQAQSVFAHWADQDDQFDVLSMGMSGDMEAAIACGSTMVRIGTDLFGARPEV